MGKLYEILSIFYAMDLAEQGIVGIFLNGKIIKTFRWNSRPPSTPFPPRSIEQKLCTKTNFHRMCASDGSHALIGFLMTIMERYWSFLGRLRSYFLYGWTFLVSPHKMLRGFYNTLCHFGKMIAVLGGFFHIIGSNFLG